MWFNILWDVCTGETSQTQQSLKARARFPEIFCSWGFATRIRFSHGTYLSIFNCLSIYSSNTSILPIDTNTTASSFSTSRRRANIQPHNLQLKRVLAAITPCNIQIQPTPLTVLEIHTHNQHPAVLDIPERAGKDGACRGDDNGTAAGDEFFGVIGGGI